jgi:hypothetical protein
MSPSSIFIPFSSKAYDRDQGHQWTVSYNPEQIATGQNHYHEVTNFFSKLYRPPETEYDQGI